MRTLREWRVSRLLGTKKLAALAGVSNKTVVDLEYGRKSPSFGSMAKLSAALGVEPEEVAEFAAALEERGKDAA